MRTKILIIGITTGLIVLTILSVLLILNKRDKNDKVDITTPKVTTQPREIVPTIVSDESDHSEAPNDEKIIDDYQKDNEPDVFLANRTPYEEELFSITSELDIDGNGYYVFTVTLLGDDKETARTRARTWMLTQGLTQKQIDSIDVIYIE